MGDSAHAGAILAANLKLRAVLKRKLGGSENGTLWILDTCSSVKNPSELPVPEKLAALKSISARDGVHLTDEGSKTLASNIGEVIHKLQNGLLGKVPSVMTGTSAVSISGGGMRRFWRGFTSPVGSRGRSHLAAWQKVAKERSFKNFGPYHQRRGWGGGAKILD